MKPSMNATAVTATMDIDALLQDSYLLVVRLREGSQVCDAGELWTLCCAQVDATRHALEAANSSQRSLDHILHAQCALLDETVLACAGEDVRARWSAEPLQTRYFGRHHAGESLYEDIREVLAEGAPDIKVLTVFQRVLMLGFKGRYATEDAPQRQQLWQSLSERVAPLLPSSALPTRPEPRRRLQISRWLQMPAVQGVLAALLLVACWWVLDQLLGDPAHHLIPGGL